MDLADRINPRTERLSRRERRALDRRADRAFEKVRGSLIAANAAWDWAIVDETGAVRIIPGEHVPVVLAGLGLADYFAHVEAERSSRSFGWIPALIVIDGLASVRWLESFTLSPGGVA